MVAGAGGPGEGGVSAGNLDDGIASLRMGDGRSGYSIIGMGIAVVRMPVVDGHRIAADPVDALPCIRGGASAEELAAILGTGRGTVVIPRTG